jgi:hypothetical protein
MHLLAKLAIEQGLLAKAAISCLWAGVNRAMSGCLKIDVLGLRVVAKMKASRAASKAQVACTAPYSTKYVPPSRPSLLSYAASEWVLLGQRDKTSHSLPLGRPAIEYLYENE